MDIYNTSLMEDISKVYIHCKDCGCVKALGNADQCYPCFERSENGVTR
jgi:hypothetical protein